ncbi:membrane protein [Actinoplanes capillaceus]|uniref:Membrane protein n=1 Tax=Actinoplanes campanulatus TaxID=113559 RepID=A0ABQ3WPM3_9ACTN|nr:membrane protein [Actinoplanes capillaceus]
MRRRGRVVSLPPSYLPAGGPDPDGASAGKRTYGPDFLTALFQNPLDPGYQDAAARRATEGRRRGWRRSLAGGSSALTLVVIGFLLVVAYRQTVAEEPARTVARESLITQVQKRREETDRLREQADRLGDEVAALRDRALGGAALAELRDLEAVTGMSRVRGSGAKVTLVDGPTSVDAVTGERRTEGQVKDTDLQLAANALWEAGAEAIMINGQRLTATSRIRQAGEAILVDIRPVASPYEVVAIGPEDLADDFRAGYAGQFFETLSGRYGISFKAAEVKDVTLEAATEFQLRSATPSIVPAPSGSASSSGPGSPAPGSSTEGGR